jgi:membrane protein implicated in regulation of membrane protease activity
VNFAGLLFLFTGLVLGVAAMLYGTERRVRTPIAPHERQSEHDPAAEPSPVFNLASLAAFTFGFGLTAYLVSRHADWPIAGEVAAAGVAGALSMTLQSVLIARWAIPGARADQPDARYLLQGTIGRITLDVPEGGEGAMRYELEERSYELPSRTIDGGALAAGSEVVIDRVEDGIAFVESWAVVEQRL